MSKGNPYHLPKGPGGGQFTSGNIGGPGSATAKANEAATAHLKASRARAEAKHAAGKTRAKVWGANKNKADWKAIGDRVFGSKK